MTEKPTSRVSLGKSGSGAAAPVPAVGVGVKPDPPKYARWAVVAMAVSGVAALVAALSLFGEKSWLLRSAKQANAKLKKSDQKTLTQLHHSINTTVITQLIATIILVLALALLARAVWSGRHWARWAVIGIWVLSTFTGTFAGFTFIITIGTSEPLVFKAPAFVAALGFVVAVVLTNLRPSVAYFNLSRPERATRRQPRGGLFTPRDPVRAARLGRITPDAAAAGPRRATAKSSIDQRFEGDSNTERARAKQRANADAVARGAELARARAKASKSRRTGV